MNDYPSLIDVMSQMICGSGIVSIGRVVNVLFVRLEIRIAMDWVVCIVGEEKSVPGTVLLIFSIHLITVGLVMSFEGSLLGNVKLLLGDHSGEWSEVRAWVPWVVLLRNANSVKSKCKATKNASWKESFSELLSGQMSRINVGEIVNESLDWYDGNSTLIFLSSATKPNAERSSHYSTNNHISEESELELILLFSLILPCPSLRASHILSESHCEPWITHELRP